MNDLKTHLLDLAERKPNMRLYSVVHEIRKFEKTQQMAEENFHRQFSIQMRVTPPSFFARLRNAFLDGGF